MTQPLELVFRAAAQKQVLAAQVWYEQQRPGLGEEFAHSLNAAITRISNQPLAAPLVHDAVRRVVLKRFPYSIFYLVEPEKLVVLRCLHTRRDPNIWP